MRKLLFVPVFIAIVNSGYAQTTAGMTHERWEENDTHPKMSASANTTNLFTEVEMSLNGNAVAFSGLPEVKHAVYAVLTNSEGEYIRQAKISSAQNELNIGKLHSGLYFVTIVYRSQSKKAFTLNL